MKKISILFILLVFCVATLSAQSPEKFSYQAVVRNASNQLVTNANVGVRVSVLQGTADGTPVYVETHVASTNANGLVTLEIGGGEAQQGVFADINWGVGPYFLKTEVDPAGGESYTVTSVQQMLSVPYALYSKEAGNGFSGDYNDLINTPTIPTNVGAFTNDAGYVTAGEVPAQVNADWDATEGPARILNKPVNGDFGHGIVRNKVNNPSGETDIAVSFSTYELVNGGVVSIAFSRPVPEGASLNINNKGSKPIYYHEAVLAVGIIKANDRCLFMYNSSSGRYYLIAIDRWGADLNALATVAHTGDYNDLTNTPTIPTVNNAKLTVKQNGTTLGTFTANQSTNKTVDITTLTAEQVQTMINDAMSEMQQQMDSLQEEQLSSLQDVVSVMPQTYLRVPFSGSRSVTLDKTITHVDVYDWGGPDGSYGNDWNGSLTLVTRNANKVFKITGSYFTEEGISPNNNLPFDYLGIFNGSSADFENIIVMLFGNDKTISHPIYSSGDTITIFFKSDVSTFHSGFTLSIDIVSAPTTLPGCTTDMAMDVQGHFYSTVQIGNQCWMKENLRTRYYPDGTYIDVVSNIGSTSTGYMYDYYSSSLTLEQRGYLYNWVAVMHGESSSSANPSGVQGICPVGWHVPSDAEWTQLKNYVGSVSSYQCSGSSTYIASALASTMEWESTNQYYCCPGNANSPNNATGFSAFPAGYWNNGFYKSGEETDFWTSTAGNNSLAKCHFIWHDDNLLYSTSHNKSYGHSVRCVRNE